MQIDGSLHHEYLRGWIRLKCHQDQHYIYKYICIILFEGVWIYIMCVERKCSFFIYRLQVMWAYRCQVEENKVQRERRLNSDELPLALQIKWNSENSHKNFYLRRKVRNHVLLYEHHYMSLSTVRSSSDLPYCYTNGASGCQLFNSKCFHFIKISARVWCRVVV